eukprot:TRINITY_DN3187_c0_g1_i1.p1 TRINITY_DN3187_c0_g1~~TRINITY_DN3187_c0_g1_i1.p1  ORF type:complete len:597 (+),score=77.10 TRINITY_DN3187_c0_g1_i1:67-1791(+)
MALLVFVRTGDSVLPVEVSSDATVDDLLAEARAQAGLATCATRFVLVHAAEVLRPGGAALADLGVGPETTLWCRSWGHPLGRQDWFGQVQSMRASAAPSLDQLLTSGYVAVANETGESLLSCLCTAICTSGGLHRAQRSFNVGEWLSNEDAVLAVTTPDDLGRTALHSMLSVCPFCALRSVSVLMAAGSDVAATDVDGLTPLHSAVMSFTPCGDWRRYRNPEPRRYTTRAHQQPELGRGLPGHCVTLCHPECIEKLHKAWAGPDRNADMLRRLAAGAVLAERERCARPLLHWAVAGGIYDVSTCGSPGGLLLVSPLAQIATALLDAGADPSRCDAEGRLPLHHAVGNPGYWLALVPATDPRAPPSYLAREHVRCIIGRLAAFPGAWVHADHAGKTPVDHFCQAAAEQRGRPWWVDLPWPTRQATRPPATRRPDATLADVKVRCGKHHSIPGARLGRARMEFLAMLCDLGLPLPHCPVFAMQLLRYLTAGGDEPLREHLLPLLPHALRPSDFTAFANSVRVRKSPSKRAAAHGCHKIAAALLRLEPGEVRQLADDARPAPSGPGAAAAAPERGGA